MSDSALPMVLLGGLAGVIALVAVAMIYQARVLTARRLHALEDALRVYNNASAALGRRLLTLESQLVKERSPAAPAVVASPRPLATAEDEEFSVAELRLAQLIKSRLGGLRLN